MTEPAAGSDLTRRARNLVEFLTRLIKMRTNLQPEEPNTGDKVPLGPGDNSWIQKVLAIAASIAIGASPLLGDNQK